MIDNHQICDFTVFHPDFAAFNHLGHRDKQVIRQCIQNFSVVTGLMRSQGQVPKVLEMGAGLSTFIFSKLLSHAGEQIKTIDAFAQDAIHINTRGTSTQFNINDLKNCEVIQGVTIDNDELQAFYGSTKSTLLNMPQDAIASHLDAFINLAMDDRKYQKINQIIDQPYLSAAFVKDYFVKNSLFNNEIYSAYRTQNDEFDFLKNTRTSPVLRTVLDQYAPNIIYLDSGEYSSNIEFNIIDEMAPAGTLLMVQDIFFPKSIKSFMIASAIMVSDKWRVLWIDKTTPQGMIICRKAA